MSTTAILFNDLHLTSKTPAGRTDVWEDTLFGKLDQVSQIATKTHAEAVLIAGDLFHIKRHVSYEVLTRFAAWCRASYAAGAPVLVIPGNHDELENRVDSLSRLPFGVLRAAGAIMDVSYQLALVGDDLAVSGMPYPDAGHLERYASLPMPPPDRVGVLMAHTFADWQAGDYFGDPIIGFPALTDLLWTVYHFGHDHRDQRIVQFAAEDTPLRYAVRIGALMRGARAGDDLTRTPKVAILTADAGRVVSLQAVKLRVRPAFEVFDLAAKQEAEREADTLAAFVTQLGQDVAAVPVEAQWQEKLQAMGLAETVRDRAVAYIQSAEST